METCHLDPLQKVLVTQLLQRRGTRSHASLGQPTDNLTSVRPGLGPLPRTVTAPGGIDGDTLWAGISGHCLSLCPPASLPFLLQVLTPKAALQGRFWEPDL